MKNSSINMNMYSLKT